VTYRVLKSGTYRSASDTCFCFSAS
jgi:hypothetical protein